MRLDSGGGLGKGLVSTAAIASCQRHHDEGSTQAVEVIRARTPLIPGPRLPIDTHQSVDTKQISISQYSLPRPAS